MSLCDGSWVLSLGPLLCETDVIVIFVFLLGALFCDKSFYFYMTFRANVQYGVLPRAKVLYVPKWTPLEISHFGFMGYPWVLRSDLSISENGCGSLRCGCSV